MDERNVIGGFVMAIMSNLFDFMEPLKWFLLLGFILIMVDTRGGNTSFEGCQENRE